MATKLEYVSADLKVAANRRVHRTDKFHGKELIVRRATTFEITVTFNRAYNAATDKLAIVLSTGPNPTAMYGSKVVVPVDTDVDKTKWDVAVDSQAGKTTGLEVNVPADAVIGKYKFGLTVGGEMNWMKDVTVLFNPFNKDDEVYMPSKVEHDEYVMNEQGYIYAGSHNRIGKVRWTFGQFEAGVLDAVLKMFSCDLRYRKNANKAIKNHHDPVYVSRVLAAMVNSNDDKGVLVGNWSGNYWDGKAPTDWNGSAKIIKQWSSTNKSVKYGQCWVFSGVLTTCLRAIGIPARPVTNFNSAHDVEFNMSIDKFFYEDGSSPWTTISGDSIWNFHVWNDCWMKRPDLGAGYDGWQSVDSTPQEMSDKQYQCGPAPVKAIKNGEVNIGYDTDFLFGEVNADMNKWQIDYDDKILKRIGCDKAHVGKCISTKAPGSNTRLDITDDYKHPEGTAAERTAYNKAKLRGKLPAWHKNVKTQPEGRITIDILPKVQKVRTGQPVEFNVSVKNTTASAKKLKIVAKLESMYYNGHRKSGVKQTDKEQNLQPGEVSEFKMTAAFSEYGFVLTPDRVIRCHVAVKNSRNNNLYVDTLHTVLKHPRCVALTIPAVVNKGPVDIKFIVTNPFPVSLSLCKISLDGVGVDGEAAVPHPIVSGGTYTGLIKAVCSRTGNQEIVANMESVEVKSIKAKGRITVK